MSANSVENHVVKDHFLMHRVLFTLEENHVNVLYVEKSLIITLTSDDTGWFTWERNQTNAVSVETAIFWETTTGSRLERNDSKATCVGNSSKFLPETWENTQERSPINVLYVEKPLVDVLASANTRGFTLERNHLNVDCVEKSSMEDSLYFFCFKLDFWLGNEWICWYGYSGYHDAFRNF